MYILGDCTYVHIWGLALMYILFGGMVLMYIMEARIDVHITYSQVLESSFPMNVTSCDE